MIVGEYSRRASAPASLNAFQYMCCLHSFAMGNMEFMGLAISSQYCLYRVHNSLASFDTIKQENGRETRSTVRESMNADSLSLLSFALSSIAVCAARSSSTES